MAYRKAKKVKKYIKEKTNSSIVSLKGIVRRNETREETREEEDHRKSAKIDALYRAAYLTTNVYELEGDAYPDMRPSLEEEGKKGPMSSRVKEVKEDRGPYPGRGRNSTVEADEHGRPEYSPLCVVRSKARSMARTNTRNFDWIVTSDHKAAYRKAEREYSMGGSLKLMNGKENDIQKGRRKRLIQDSRGI